MKLVSEKKALETLYTIKSDYKTRISEGYEHRAKSCLTCETRGACCLDAHFVNVHISALEAAAFRQALDLLPAAEKDAVYVRVDEAIERYGLSAEGETFAKTYACPLFVKEIGCLVHNTGKPLPCITHACYENPGDLPPSTLQTDMEEQVDKLNQRTYGRPRPWLPIPIALRQNR